MAQSDNGRGESVVYDLSPVISLLETFRLDYLERLKAVGTPIFGSKNVVSNQMRLRPSQGKSLWQPDSSSRGSLPPTAKRLRSKNGAKTLPVSTPLDSAGLNRTSQLVGERPIHIVIDNSNIYYGLLNLLRERHGQGAFSGARIDYPRLIRLIAGGREILKCCVVASEGIGQAGRVKRLFDQMGFQSLGGKGFYSVVLQRVPVLERNVENGGRSLLSKTPRNEYLQLRAREQSVDESLHHAISLSLLDYEPSTLIIVTGDGGASPHSAEGFPGMVKRALSKGWHVEVVSWSASLSASFCERFGHENNFTIRLLDQYLHDISFVDEKSGSSDELENSL
jgi:hypothetical protein